MLGGEGSGHIICLDRTTTGDGIVSALQVLHAVCQSGNSLHNLKMEMIKYPQKLVNVKVSAPVDLSSENIVNAVKNAESQLNKRGRVLLRASGTEPVVRVMVEGENTEEVDSIAYGLAKVVEESAVSN